MEIRPYTAADYEATVAMWREVSRATYTFLDLHTEDEDRGYFRDVIAVENDLWVAHDDSQIAGYLALRQDYIDRLYVAVGRQGEGVGTALLEHARTLSPAGLRLCTHQKNVRACRFYERRGFEAIRYGLSPPPEAEPDVEYAWRPA